MLHVLLVIIIISIGPNSLYVGHAQVATSVKEVQHHNLEQKVIVVVVSKLGAKVMMDPSFLLVYVYCSLELVVVILWAYFYSHHSHGPFYNLGLYQSNDFSQNHSPFCPSSHLLVVENKVGDKVAEMDVVNGICLMLFLSSSPNYCIPSHLVPYS